MDRRTFWELAARSGEAGASVGEQADRLAALLSPLSEEELVAFHAELAAVHRSLYTWDVWTAGNLALGWMSDDVFADFRSLLLARGEAERFSFVVGRVYAERTGVELYEAFPDTPSAEFPDGDPSGERLNEDDPAVLSERFPRLVAATARRRSRLRNRFRRT